MRVNLTVNGRALRADDVWEGESLLYLLRERLGLPGSKNACEQGECGSCTVRLDGVPVCACLVAAGQAEGREVLTVEGLAEFARGRERPSGRGELGSQAAGADGLGNANGGADAAGADRLGSAAGHTDGDGPEARGSGTPLDTARRWSARPADPGAAQLAPVQRAFLDAGAVQCGFCTPGLLVAADELLERCPRPSDADIREALSGNLCRCTGYEKIMDAVRLAAARQNGEA
ncbi:(2Fe-2S)-binding protein [Streptomyces sp. NA04227]|uniref:(2Fe-2S)-binding protein n=1 Tax=Streptomyces sp. NA04227 TaxID=2742136 RepID=UPI0015906B85|nr:(2Fe-2S)-binding protein [Streptomyces sp. NA04227]QKW10027.1 (2Fe-2S)-binding protein [Streptomyces sp. NA04227]